MRVDHVALWVNDLEMVRDFFVKYFEAESNEMYHNKTSGFRSYFLTFETGTRLEIMNKPSVADSEKYLERTGYSHIAFSVGSAEKVNDLTERLRQAGYKVLSGPRKTGDGYYESCLIGIENNVIEITI